MHRVISMCLDAAVAALMLVPLFFFLNKHCFHSKVRTVFYSLLAVYLSGMFSVVGLPDIRYVRFDPNFNFVPFAYMFSDFTNSLLNVLLFLPLGFFLPVLWLPYRQLRRTVFFGLCISLLIEALQIFTFRATDVNDLITNTVGTVLGWVIAKCSFCFSQKIIPRSNCRELYLVCFSAFFVMFFLQPFLADWLFQYI